MFLCGLKVANRGHILVAVAEIKLPYCNRRLFADQFVKGNRFFIQSDTFRIFFLGEVRLRGGQWLSQGHSMLCIAPRCIESRLPRNTGRLSSSWEFDKKRDGLTSFDVLIFQCDAQAVVHNENHHNSASR